MRKALSLILLAALTCMVFAFSGCGTKADYESAYDMYSAYCKKENIVGKTVSVDANCDYYKGAIYDGVTPDFSTSITIYVGEDAAKDVKKGKTYVVKIDKVETELAGFNVYGKIV